jgi:hypothetical protein
MKKVFLIVTLIFVGFSTINAQSYAISADAKKLEIAKNTGVYEFIMGADVTEDKVAEVSKYYTEYFTIKFDEATHKATITLFNKDETSKMVMTRYFITIGADKIAMGDELMPIQDYFKKYIL